MKRSLFTTIILLLNCASYAQDSSITVSPDTTIDIPEVIEAPIDSTQTPKINHNDTTALTTIDSIEHQDSTSKPDSVELQDSISKEDSVELQDSVSKADSIDLINFYEKLRKIDSLYKAQDSIAEIQDSLEETENNYKEIEEEIDQEEIDQNKEDQEEATDYTIIADDIDAFDAFEDQEGEEFDPFSYLKAEEIKEKKKNERTHQTKEKNNQEANDSITLDTNNNTYDNEIEIENNENMPESAQKITDLKIAEIYQTCSVELINSIDHKESIEIKQMPTTDPSEYVSTTLSDRGILNFLFGKIIGSKTDLGYQSEIFLDATNLYFASTKEEEFFTAYGYHRKAVIKVDNGTMNLDIFDTQRTGKIFSGKITNFPKVYSTGKEEGVVINKYGIDEIAEFHKELYYNKTTNTHRAFIDTNNNQIVGLNMDLRPYLNCLSMHGIHNGKTKKENSVFGENNNSNLLSSDKSRDEYSEYYPSASSVQTSSSSSTQQ